MKRSGLASVAFLAISIGALTSCTSTDREGVRKENQPPTVWLAAAPPEGTVTSYTIHMFWGGWDPDGEIAYYEYAITDNGLGSFDPADTTGHDKWHRVYANDSTFTFTADSLAETGTIDVEAEFRRTHTFFIRAVDEEGVASREPAYRSFTARTISPRVDIQVPLNRGVQPALVPPISTFRWTAQDKIQDEFSVQDPESVQWALVNTIRFAGVGDRFAAALDYLNDDSASADEWSKWVWYGAPQDSGKFWTTPPMPFGDYMFAIRAKDEAGAVTPILDERYNARRVTVSRRSTGPVMTVSNEFLGNFAASSCSSPLVIADLPAGVPLQFRITADASGYGGTVSGYRYGWDIADFNDPQQWEIDYTPFTSSVATVPARTFFFGSHTFTAETLDNSGFCSRLSVRVNIVEFTMTKPLLLIDDYSIDLNQQQSGWNNPINPGAIPSDAEHDQFWADMLVDVNGFDPNIDQLEVNAQSNLPLTVFSDYKSIIWSVWSDKGTTDPNVLPLLNQFIQHRRAASGGGGTIAGRQRPNLLSLFMAAGGHLMIAGRHPVSNVISRGLLGNNPLHFPVITLYDLEGGQDNQRTYTRENPVGTEDYSYRELCVDILDYAVLTLDKRRGNDDVCDVVFVRNGESARVSGMRAAIPLDPNFPRLELRPETSDPGRAHAVDRAGYDAELYNTQYFYDHCLYATGPRSCFQPIYGMECIDRTLPVYGQPVAFWTTTMADRVAEVPGAVAARSVVFGFPPVYFKPAQVKPAMDYILFTEWQLPRVP